MSTSGARLWRLAPDDPNDFPTVIHLSADTNGPTCVLDIVDAGGITTTARARRFATLLMAAADYADSCVIGREESA